MSIGRSTFLHTALGLCGALTLICGVHAAAQPLAWSGVVVTANEESRSISLGRRREL